MYRLSEGFRRQKMESLTKVLITFKTTETSFSKLYHYEIAIY